MKRVSVFLLAVSLMFLPQAALAFGFGGGAVTGATTGTVKQVTEEVAEDSTVNNKVQRLQEDIEALDSQLTAKEARLNWLKNHCRPNKIEDCSTTAVEEAIRDLKQHRADLVAEKARVESSVASSSTDGEKNPSTAINTKNTANESAIQKAKKQRKRLILAAFVSGGAGLFLLKTKCNPTPYPNFQPPDPGGVHPPLQVTGFVKWLGVKAKIIGGPPNTTFGCVLGPLAIGAAAMLVKRSMEMKKTIAQLSGGDGNGGGSVDPEPISDIEVPCLEDPTKTCLLVNGGTHITTLDGSPPKSIEEIAKNLPPHDAQTLAGLEEAMAAQQEAIAQAKALDPGFDPIAELKNPAASPLNAEAPPLQPLTPSVTPEASTLIGNGVQETSIPVVTSGGPTGNWMQAQCEVENSVHTVSDEGRMVDVLCGSDNTAFSVRETPNPPNVSTCTQTETAVAVRDADASNWASVSCMNKPSADSIVSIRNTDRGQWADVSCPAANKVVSVRMANTDKWVSVQCREVGQVVSLRSGQPLGTDNALYAQFAGSSVGGSAGSQENVESLPFGNDRIASVNENLFAVIGTQYQNHRNNGEFIEGPNNNTPPFVIPASTGAQ